MLELYFFVFLLTSQPGEAAAACHKRTADVAAQTDLGQVQVTVASAPRIPGAQLRGDIRYTYGKGSFQYLTNTSVSLFLFSLFSLSFPFLSLSPTLYFLPQSKERKYPLYSRI